ncbi:ABC transporter ATP-binding protein [Aurantimonas sp. MSK8Z-1]|uniref:ABC transporter ATP-binding protein n=1 Tax=Mangrovibrevibacter kandeliae TaxID=2968473 RepID=UPI0021186D51|nr:ABC transporter ATP-binding protein [Aurantimonas sp. MSK8Z-1]MCW4116190.1 ABC transporter ATP-binding protein [Aurantimonas sp. MSK8Z-1]
MSALLQVSNLSLTLPMADGRRLPVLADIGFSLGRGERLGIVGESGSGKTMLALALIGLEPETAGLSGSIRFDDRELLGLPEYERARLRGRRIAMIFQEPMSALNPAMPIGAQIAEGPLRIGLWRRSEARARAIALLERVRLPEAARRADAYAHQLSGGQRQRVMIAMALAQSPDLLIADEPTTALDATLRDDMLDLVAGLVEEEGMSLLLVSHDLRAVARASDRVLVLYAGTRFEDGPTADVLGAPLNPYTRALIAALPRRPDVVGRPGPRPRLAAIDGQIPALGDLPTGCRFADRCACRIGACTPREPDWRELAGRGVRCIRAVPAGTSA